MRLDILSSEYRTNPYPIFKYLRQKKMVCRSEPYGYWLIPTYLDVQMILKNKAIFRSSGMGEEPTADSAEFFLHSRGLIGCDPPDHSRLRRILSRAFTPLSIRKLQPKISTICSDLIKHIIMLDTVNIVDTFCVPLPIRVVAELIGIDPEKHAEFKQWADLLISWRKLGKTADVLKMATQMFDYFNELIAARKKILRDDLISQLILACENENMITASELLAMIRLLLIAGTETTTNLIANGIHALCLHPPVLAQLRRDSSQIINFIEEILRYDGPVLSLSRRVEETVEIVGVKIYEGDIVLPLVASANHDETVFSQPEKLDINRKFCSHLTFGAGNHYCLGSQLARLQARIAFEALLNSFSKFEISATKELEYLDSFFFRGVKKLWLVTPRRYICR